MNGKALMNGKTLYRPLDWLMVRTPLLPVDDYLALRDGWPTDTAPGTLAPADPRIYRALAVGGGDLLRALEKPARDDRAQRKLAGKLLRYLIRMSTRPTPYGLFAGVCLAHWGERTDLALAGDPPRTRTRPDMAWLLGVVAELERRPEVRSALHWFANPAVLVRADRLFLAERAPVAEDAAAQPISLRATGPVREALRIARTPVTYQRLREELSTSSGAPAEKVERLLDQLWEQTVLLTDLRPPLTIAEPARYVAERLAAVPAASAEREALSQLLDALGSWDRLPVEHAAAAYPKLVAQAQTLHPASVPLQVDMAVTPTGTVGRAIATEAARAGELLLRLSPTPKGPSSLDSYRRAFDARYGANREVPLLELVDPETGLGPPGHAHSAGPKPSRLRVLRNLALDAIRDRRTSVELDEKTLSLLETWPVNGASAPVSLDISVFVAAASAKALEAGDFQVVVGPNLGAPAAGRNLGRFADLLGPDAPAVLSGVAKAETQVWPGRLMAEVVYLPRRWRSANVVIRPLVRDHHVVLGTTPGERAIPLEELTVGLRDGRFVLRWPARDVEVVPCAGHMLNTRQAPAVVRFLDDIARDGRPQLSGFDWGPAAEFPFTPRVCVGRVVLAPATWRIGADTAVADWAVPRYVYLTMGDNRLLLDLDNPAQRGQLESEVRRLPEGGRLVLQEALPGPGTAWLPGTDGRYISEFVVPLVLREKQPAPPKTVARPARSSAAPTSVPSRVRPPGSEWLFAKLYHLPAFENDLIAGELRDFCARVLSDDLAEDWFFIRYADPERHLRIRFRGGADTLATTLAPRLYRWAAGLIDDGRARRLCVDTYEPEVERYGGPAGLAISEKLFAVDSRAVADLLRLDRPEHTVLAARTVDDLLAALGFDETARVEWYREHVPDRRPTGEDYRRRQADLRAALSAPEFGGEATAVLEDRRAAIEPLAARFDELAARGDLWQSKSRIARSLVHLHCNRLLGSGSPTEQHVLGLLLRTRESLLHAPARS